MRLLPLLRRVVRLRLRTLMILIALLAVIVTAKMRHDRCMERARFYGAKADLYRTHADTWHSWTGAIDIRPEYGAELFTTDGVKIELRRNEFQDLAEKCERLRAGFERASWQPFARTPAELRPEEFLVPGGVW